MSFVLGQHVVYNPNIENLAPPIQRPHDLGRIIAIDEHYAQVHFPAYDYTARILFCGLSPLSSDIPLPTNISLLNVNNTQQIDNTSRPCSPIIIGDTDSE